LDLKRPVGCINIFTFFTTSTFEGADLPKTLAAKAAPA